MLNTEIITEAERNEIFNNMTALLDEYNYNYRSSSISKIIDTWAENKADLICLFKKHPNYVEGKFLIAFDKDYTREIDVDALHHFGNWLIWNRTKIELPSKVAECIDEDYDHNLPREIYGLFASLHHYSERTLSEYNAKVIREIVPESHAHNGQKTTKVINKLCTYLGYDKLPDYQKEFAKYADALSPLAITRHTVISINPIDYLTMSFGNSWASCHTIDKANIRHMPNSYEGLYSSGTISYMLDSTSMVFYTVDASYNGTDYFFEPKITRQMYHYGWDMLVQGRLYPQSNDGQKDLYGENRAIMQKVMSDILEVPNLWTLKRGTSAIAEVVDSEGTHYRDYLYFESCTLSTLKGSEPEECMMIGHDPICISCGYEHSTQDNIDCCHSYSMYTCTECGCSIDEDDVIWVNDEPYCEDCVEFCPICNEPYLRETMTYVEGYGYIDDYCLSENFVYCEDCDEYVHYDNAIWVESEDRYVCSSCYENGYAECSECHDVYLKDDMHEVNGKYYCDCCVADVAIEDSEEESEAC